jgi:hypothetical protein
MAMEAFDEGALILHLTKLTFYELNSTARDILKVTDGKNDIEQVAKIIAGEYGIDPDLARQDVTGLYQDLAKQGIVEMIPLIQEKEG